MDPRIYLDHAEFTAPTATGIGSSSATCCLPGMLPAGCAADAQLLQL